MNSVQNVSARIVRAGPAAIPSLPVPAAADIVAALSATEKAAVEELINRLFREIRNARPAWRQAWPNKEALDSAKITWVKTMIEGGIRDWDAQVELGLRRLRAEPSDFVPAPGKFVEWCSPTPESLGLQTAERAYDEACRNAHPSCRSSAAWSHPVTYHAAIDVGLDVLMQLPGTESWKLFARSYAVMTRRAMAGQALGMATPLGIGHDSQKPEAMLAEEQSLQFALRVREAQGIPQSGEEARQALLAKFAPHRARLNKTAGGAHG